MQLHPPAPEGRSRPVLHLGHVPYDLILIVVSFLLTSFQDSDGDPFSRVPYENSIAGSHQYVRNYYRYLLILQTVRIYSDASGKVPGWRSAVGLYCKFNRCAVYIIVQGTNVCMHHVAVNNNMMPLYYSSSSAKSSSKEYPISSSVK